MVSWSRGGRERHWLLLCVSLACAESAPGGVRPRPTYTKLSETGLYANFETRALASDVMAYSPAYSLWADGADKARWLSVPPGSKLDTGDIDHWRFPVGTRVWKEFSLAGVPLETRLIERHGAGPDDYWMGSFVWRADGSDAELRAQGAADVLGTEHDVPSQEQCLACHRGEPGRILGFSAIQLAGRSAAGGLDLAQLAADGWLSAPPGNAGHDVAGDEPAQAALGYLHANCGHCHNQHGSAWPDTQLVLRLSYAEDAPGESVLLQSVVRQPLQYFRDPRRPLRVVPGAPEESALLARMELRGPREQMPPLGSERVDAEGVAQVRRWIVSLGTEAATGPP